jgi:hypothetical protein
MSDKEKTRALWHWEVNHRFHATSRDLEVDDVVRDVNAYGYGICGHESQEISDLWRVAGLKVRKGCPNGHGLTGVYYSGGWHVLDSDENIISLLRNNETIASLPQIVGDHDLMMRTHTYGILAQDNRMTDEKSAALIDYQGKRGAALPELTVHSASCDEQQIRNAGDGAEGLLSPLHAADGAAGDARCGAGAEQVHRVEYSDQAQIACAP